MDVFRTVISSGKLEELLAATGARVAPNSHLAISKEGYARGEKSLAQFGFKWNQSSQQYIADYSSEVEEFLAHDTSIEAVVFEQREMGPVESQQFDSVNFWYWEHWKFFRHEVKTSIIQGIAVFLSLFETDPDVRRVFCPPKELYECANSESNPHGRVLAPFPELIETGKIVGLNFPVALNPALAKTIGTMVKIDYQRAVQLRIA